VRTNVTRSSNAPVHAVRIKGVKPDMDDPRRILHIDDDDDILQISRLALETLGGFEVMQCRSGAEAIAQATSFKPDLILIDFMMPGMNGLATLQELRKLDGITNIPAIFMTARGLSPDVDLASDADVIGTISKPFDAMALSDQILQLYRKAARI